MALGKQVEVVELFKYALILAGGRGKRLKPLTNAIPKPLLPIGDKPIIEDIILKLKKSGVRKIFISVNYKKEMIKNYLKNGEMLGIEIDYLEEESPTGTAGSLALLPIIEDMIIVNGDVLTDLDYRALYDFMNKGFDFVIVAVEQEYHIDFGVIEFDENGELKNWHEKPTYKYYINGGIYAIKRESLELVKGYIQPNEQVDMPQIWDFLKRKGKRIGVFIHKGLWKDIGHLEDYLSLI